LLHQDGANQSDDGFIVGEDANDVGAALDLAVQSLDRIGRADLRPVLLGEVHECENVDLGVIEQGCELRQTAAQLIGDMAPLFSGGCRGVLGESGCDKAETTRRPFLLVWARALRMK
jgi:hypothetical protein